MFKNVASQVVYVYAFDSIANAPKTGDAANITVYLSKDGAALAASTNSVSELDSTNAKGVYKLTLTQAETNADALLLVAKSSTSGVILDPTILYTVPASFTSLDVTKIDATVSSRATQTSVDTVAGYIDTEVAAIKTQTDKLTFNGSNEVASSIGNASAFAQAAADKVWSTTTRALTDKVGFALSGAGVQAIWDALTSALTTASSVGKLLVDNINATIGSRLASSSYTAPPTAVQIRTEIDSNSTKLDATISSRADQTSVNSIAGYVDTEVGAIKTVTDKLDTALEADGGVYRLTTNALEQAPTGGGSAPTAADIRAEIDSNSTKLAAIKAKTDNLPSDPADASDVAAAFSTVNGSLSTIAGYIDTEVGAIKAKTDQLSFSSGDVVATLAGETVSVGDKTGFSLASTGLDAVAAPADLANDAAARATFVGMVRALFNRFYNKVEQTSTQQKVYAGDGTTIVSTMATTNDGTTATKGKSS